MQVIALIGALFFQHALLGHAMQASFSGTSSTLLDLNMCPAIRSGDLILFSSVRWRPHYFDRLRGSQVKHGDVKSMPLITHIMTRDDGIAGTTKHASAIA